MVERDDAMHFRAREIERVGDDGHGRRRHVAKGGLDVVENGQQRALATRVSADDVVGLRFIPRRHTGTLQMAIGRTSGHRCLSYWAVVQAHALKLTCAAIEQIYRLDDLSPNFPMILATY
jgi:hypothetical protein